MATILLFFFWTTTAFDLVMEPLPANAILRDLHLPIQAFSENLTDYQCTDIPIVNHFYIDIKIGRPPQSFRLSPSFWDENISVTDSSCSEGCPEKKFNRYASESYRNNATLDLNYLGYDDVILPSGVIAKEILLTSLRPSNYTWAYKVDGMLGLRPADSSSESSLIRSLAKQGKARNSKFALFRNQTENSTSILSIGESHVDLYARENFAYINRDMTVPSWSINASFSFSFNGSTQNYGPYLTTFISGTDFIFLPLSVFQTLNQAICSGTRHCIETQNIITFPCNASDHFPDLFVESGDFRFTIEDQFYIHRSGGQCWLLVRARPIEIGEIVLGPPFFYSYYIEFDMETNRIGIAKSKNFKGEFLPEREINEATSFLWLWITIAVIIAGVLIFFAFRYSRPKQPEEEINAELLAGR